MDDTAALVSLAMLKVDADVEGRDYVDYLVPFVIYILDRYKVEPVSSQETQRLLREEFQLRIPVHATELVLRRLAKQRYFVREYGVYRSVRALPKNRVEILRKDARERTAAVVSALQAFVKSSHSIDWSDNEAIEAITAYLSRFSVDCLKSYAHGTALPHVVPSSPRQQTFLVNRFVIDAKANAPEVFEHLIVLVKGQLLANALICSDLDSIPRKFGGVTFYLDTPIILQLFGLEGEPLEATARELLELVKHLKGTFAVFDHTAEEVYGVIEGCERRLNDPGAKGLIITEMRRAGKTASDLALIRGRLQEIYRRFDISRRTTPPYIAHLQIDETVLHSALEEEVSYWTDRAVDYDVNSIRSIYALRRGNPAVRLEDARAVLVTSNAALARCAYEYGRNHESTREVSAVITNYSLANMSWLKAPLGSPDLPQAEVIALCYAAMNPREALWGAYLAEIDKLQTVGDISARDHELLRLSLRARDELMNLTLGSEEAFSARTVTQVLETVKSEMLREKENQLAEERAKHAEATQQLREAVDAQLEKQRTYEREAQAKLELAIRANEETRKRYFWLAERLAAIVSYPTSGLLVFALLAGLVLSGFYAKPLASGKVWISVPATVLVGVVVLWSILNWVGGWSVLDFHRHLRSWQQRTFYDALCKLFLVDPNVRPR